MPESSVGAPEASILTTKAVCLVAGARQQRHNLGFSAASTTFDRKELSELGDALFAPMIALIRDLT